MPLRSIRGDVGAFRGDVELLREGISLIAEFGIRSTERLAYVADFLERSVYAPKSLRAIPGGVAFTLLNPPLRVGAFSAVRVSWDGKPLAPDRTLLRFEGHAVDRPISDISGSRPVELRPGQRVDFRLMDVSATHGTHRVRMELQSIAVPPLVWFEFADGIAPAGRN
jgi:hypothetical protein